MFARPFCAPGRLLPVLLFLCGMLGGLQPAAAQTGGINGFVRDTQNRAVSGASVAVLSGPTTRRPVTTRSDGSFTLSGLNGGAYRFEASRTGFTSAVREFSVVSGVNARVDFTLADNRVQGTQVRGVVTRRDTSAPLGGVRVELTGAFGTQFQVTDETGLYAFTGLDTGTYRVTASRAGFTNLTRSGISVREGAAREVNLALQVRTADLATLQGNVRNENSRPVSGASVRLTDGVSVTDPVRTDSRGFYRFTRLLPGTYVAEFSATGFTTEVSPQVTLNNGQRQTLDAILTSLGAATSVLEGFITDGGGAAVRGARVTITAGPISNRSDVADANGFYRIEGLPAGRYTLAVSGAGFANATQSVDAVEGRTVRQDFALTDDDASNTGDISGRVTLAGGGAAVGVTLRVTAGPSTGQSATTDAQGEYTLSGLPEGTYSLRITRAGSRERTETGVEVTAGETTTLNVALEGVVNGGTLEGTVRNTSGATLSGILVEVLRGVNSLGSVTTASTGRYTIPNLEPGGYTIQFSGADYRTAVSQGVQIREGARTTLDVRLTRQTQRPGRIQGLVRDAAGRSVQNVDVELQGPTGLRTTRTDATGGFEFAELTPGTGYSVRVSGAGLDADVRSGLSVSGGQTLFLTFAARAKVGQGSITGTVRNSSGLTLEEATVSILNGPVVGEEQTTDDQGRYNFATLAPGRYTVEARAFGYRAVRAVIEVRAGAAAARNFFLPRD